VIEHTVSDRATTSPVFSRFAGVPTLVAIEAIDRFEGALLGLAQTDRIGELLSERAAENDGFWPAADHWMARYRPYIVANGILQIPVKGILLSDFSFAIGSYATGYTYLSRALERGLSDPNVRGIAWLHDSGGGEVQECFDVCDQIYAARGKKPMRAFCEFSYSASYALASAANKVSVTRTGGVGSVGVVTMHVDFSKALDESGVKITLIEAPRGGHKTETYPYKPLAADARERLQARTDALYSLFVSTVARNRGLEEGAVRDTKALTYMAGPAIEVGLADSIGIVADEVTAFAADLNSEEGNETMTTPKTYSQAEFDQAVAAARTEGHTAGASEAKATAAKEAETAVAAAKVEGAKGERDRVKAITSLDEAKGREPTALSFATTTDMSVDQAKAALGTVPKGSAAGDGRDSALGLSLGGPSAPEKGEAMSADEVAASINKQFGGKK